MPLPPTNRRDFLKTLAATGAGFWIAGRISAADELKSKSPNERINIASIGVGGKGDGDSDQAGKHGNLIAICDIDDKRLDAKGRKFPEAEKFNDFRKMLDKLGKQIDAVTISTPDHTHAVATMAAIQLGKHVYTQKPMTHDVWEARQLRQAAAKAGIMSQMGNQGTANHRLREGVEAIRAGVIGAVTELHIWTNRPIWPQSPVVTARPPEAPVPGYVHWDEWLGTAPARPYVEKYYHPRNWRGWWDFGTGALGDMGCHTANLPFMALRLGHPDSIYGEAETLNPEVYPAWAKVVSEFPAREGLPPVKVTWYEGRRDGYLVQPPAELSVKVVQEYNKLLASRKDKRVDGGRTLGLNTSGAIIVGDKGLLYSPSDDGKEWELLPAEAFADFKQPAPVLPRNPLGDSDKTMDEGQKVEWLAAIKGGPKPMSNFDYAGLLTEFILLGNVAIREAGTKLKWDAPNLKFPGNEKAERWLRREYRGKWAM